MDAVSAEVAPDDAQLATIGKRIKERRLKFGLSTSKLAEKAGVARYTVIRIEAGQPSNVKTLEKVRKALALFTDQMIRPYAPGEFTVHRAKETRWSVSIAKAEYQQQIENDDRIHVDDPAERRRLGSLGFQPFFTAILGSELTGGVNSQALMELYQPSWVDRHFGEEFVYCLRGSVTITVNDVPCHLEVGDGMSFDAMLPHQYAPSSPIPAGEEGALILLTVSMRPGERTPRPRD